MERDQKGHLVIGTAGHIDHGKTTLIKALTGRDLDTLKEEKQRGITVDLGFGYYGDRAAFVDVPGHERLVKNMVAGAAAMGAAMLVVAADDGIMPQTREHLAVLDAMGVSAGLAVVTKADIAESEEWIELVVEELRELLESSSLRGVPILVVDSLSGRGIDELHSALVNLIETWQQGADPGFFRMPIDRSFSIKGFGRVVAGSVWSGSCRSGESLVLMPTGQSVRVRGLQAHEATVERVNMGDRAALNLQLGKGGGELEPGRGDWLVSEGRSVRSTFCDVLFSSLPDARAVSNRARVRVHIGTAEVMARLLLVDREEHFPGEKGFARLALESELTLMQGDRGVLRLYSPLETLGGIQVLDPAPPDRRRSTKGLAARLEAISRGGQKMLEALIGARGTLQLTDLLAWLPLAKEELENQLDQLAEQRAIRRMGPKGEHLVAEALWQRWKRGSREVLAEYHRQHPDERGMQKRAWLQRVAGGELDESVTAALLAELEKENELRQVGGNIAAMEHEASIAEGDQADAARVLQVLAAGGINAPHPKTIAEETGLSEERIRGILRSLQNTGETVILDERVILARSVFQAALDQLRQQFADREFTLPEVIKLLDTTRKYAVPLLEHLDSLAVTERIADSRRFRA